MARSSGVHIEGLRETIRGLERLGVDVEDLRGAFGEISEEIVTEAGGLIQVKTGAARATIRPARTKNKAVVRAGTAGVPYPAILNYGWPAHGITGNEFLTGPANNDTDGKARRIEANLDQLIRKYRLN